MIPAQIDDTSNISRDVQCNLTAFAVRTISRNVCGRVDTDVAITQNDSALVHPRLWAMERPHGRSFRRPSNFPSVMSGGGMMSLRKIRSKVFACQTPLAGGIASALLNGKRS